MKTKITGFIVGIISGLLSSGGGLILLPILRNIYKLDEKESRATTIFCIFPLVIISGFFYLKKNMINIDLALRTSIGGIIGGIIGTIILNKLKSSILNILFTCFLFFISIRMVIA